MANIAFGNFTFHIDETGAISDGATCSVGSGESILELECKSTATCKMVFEGQGLLGIWRPLLGAKMTADLDLMTETTDIAPFYQFDVSGVSKVRIRLLDNTGITTIVGRIVG